jgi:TonB family protein
MGQRTRRIRLEIAIGAACGVAALALAWVLSRERGPMGPVEDTQSAATTVLGATKQIAGTPARVGPGQPGSGSDSLLVDDGASKVKRDMLPSDNMVDELPIPIDTPAPVYPDAARSEDVEGTVTVMALITKYGRVSNVKVTEGDPVLHDAAIAAVKRWTYKPAQDQGRPVPVWVEIPVKFTLH